MTPEERKLEEEQIKNNFSELQKKLADLKNEVQSESDDSKKQKKNNEIQRLEKELSEMKTLIDTLSSLQEADLQSLKTKLESTKKAHQEFSGEVSELQNQVIESLDNQNKKSPTPTTYEILKDSETYNRLLNIISSNPKKFKKLKKDEEGNELDTPEKKLEYIFKKIRKSLTRFLENKLGNYESTEKVINNTIAPAFEWSLMELLRSQGNETNVGMLEGMKEISWNSLENLFKGVKGFADKFGDSYSKFNQWMNAVDYLSVHNGVLRNPDKSEVLTNPLKFQEYMNDARFSANNFSPYVNISDNIFKIDNNKTFEFGISRKKKKNQPEGQKSEEEKSDEKKSDEEIILERIGNIQVVNNPKTTSLIVGLLDKPEQFFNATAGLQSTANHLLDLVDFINPITKIFNVDIFKEIQSGEKSLAYKVLDFVCKLIGITGGLEGIVKKWRMDKMNLTNEKNKNISQIFEKYKESAGENESLSIVDENSCKTALEKFAVTETQTSTTKGDFLRDSIAENMDISLVSPVVIQQTLGDSYIKKQTNTENGESIYIVDTEKFNDENKNQLAKQLAHNHLKNMKAHLEEYNKNDLSEFYTNIKSTEDLALCITASLYVDKDDVIEGVKAKVFLPENYGSVQPNGTVETNGNEQGQASGEISQYQLSPGEYPFKDVPPYKGISAYDLRNVKMTPLLDYRDLVKGHEGSVTLSGSNIINKGNEYPSNGTTGNKNNNPCDISHSNSDIGYQNSSTVADGQSLAKYDTPVNGIASAMRLLKNKYSNKSITEINVGGYQGYYKPNEEIGLSALRIKWITDQCNALGIGPHQMLNFDDPTTLKSFVAQIAVLETGTHIGQQLLDEAYNLAFA